MQNRAHPLILPLLSTLFFGVILLSLNVFYTPVEPDNATPTAPITAVVNRTDLDAQ